MATIDQTTSLGPELLKCRRRSYAAVHWNLSGLYGAHQLILLPIIVSFIAVGVLFFAVEKTVGMDSLGLPRMTPIGLMVTVFVGMLLLEFVALDANLVLHENGIVYKRKKIPFSQLKSVLIGQNRSVSAEIARGLGSLMSWHPASRMVERSDEGSVTLELANDKTLVMKNVLLENKSEDTQKLFGYIQKQHPEVVVQS